MITGMFIVYAYAAAMTAWNEYAATKSIGPAVLEGLMWPLMVWAGRPQ